MLPDRKSHVLFGGSQASPAYPSGHSTILRKISMAPSRNGTGSEAEVL